MRVDEVRSFSLIELKAYHESSEFFAAMAHLLRHASVMMTTYPKIRLVEEIRRRAS